MSNLLAQANPFGKIDAPDAIKGREGFTGLVDFLTVILRFLVVVAGVYALINVIFAGYQFMSAGGDPKNIEKAWGRIWQSLVGLLLVAGSFLIAAIIGQLIFGDPTAILVPKIQGLK